MYTLNQLRSHSNRSNLFQSTSLADLGSSLGMLLVSIWQGTSLHLLAQLRRIHRLPPLNSLHPLEEQARGTFGTHVTFDILVKLGALLEDTNGIMIRSKTIVVVLQ